MNRSSNLNMYLPESSDYRDVSQLTANFSTLDGSVGALADGLAIVSVGNTHAAIASGQYVYIMNHASLSEGLYRATSAISANTSLSGSNVTAVSGGGLNAVEAKVTTYSQMNNVRGYIGGGSSDVTATTHTIVSLTITTSKKGILFFSAEGPANLTANEVMMFKVYDGSTLINNYGSTNTQGKQWISTSGYAMIPSTGSRTFKIDLTTYNGATNITIPAYCQMAGNLMFMPFG